MRTTTVANVDMPVLGLGTWRMRGAECREAVAEAIAMGYRHIDTAQAYGNEAEVGGGIADSGIDRDELFVVTKVSDRNRTADRVRPSAEASAEALGLSSIDLLLLHRPGPPDVTMEVLEAMQEMTGDDGPVSHIGVSNFSAEQAEAARSTGPMLTNQIERHVYHQRSGDLVDVEGKDMVITAYSPLARGRVADDPTLAEVGEKHTKTPAQVALRWLLDQPGCVVIPKAAQRVHLSENLRVFDFDLDEEDHRAIERLERSDSALS